MYGTAQCTQNAVQGLADGAERGVLLCLQTLHETAGKGHPDAEVESRHRGAQAGSPT